MVGWSLVCGAMASTTLFILPHPHLVLSSSKQQQKQALRQPKRSKPLDFGCDTQSLDNLQPLHDWLIARGLPSQKLALQRVETGDRGLVATRNIRQGEKLLYVPSALTITTDSDWSNTQAGEVLRAEGVPDWPFLASYLISEASQGTLSPWNAYISALPQQPESILQWSISEVETYLAASPVRDQAIERIVDVTETYRTLQSSIFSKHPQLFSGKFFKLEAFKWAFGILFSRLVRFPSLDDKVALVPWADMLNHSSKVNAYLDFESSSNAVILTTDRSYRPHEQVFISYGKRQNGEMLLSYGFISSDNIEDDSVDLVLAIDPLDEAFVAKVEALKGQGLSSPCRFPITMSGLPSQLSAFARLVVCPSSMAPHFSQMASAATQGMEIKDGSISSLVTVSLDIKGYGYILASCEAALAKYQKFFEANQEVFDAVQREDRTIRSSRQVTLAKIAFDLCTREQRILFRTQTVLRSKLRELRASRASEERQSASTQQGTSLLDGFHKIFG